jgi:hypothetical protein
MGVELVEPRRAPTAPGSDDLRVLPRRARAVASRADLGRTRTQLVCRLHVVLCEPVPGGVPKAITAAYAPYTRPGDRSSGTATTSPESRAIARKYPASRPKAVSPIPCYPSWGVQLGTPILVLRVCVDDGQLVLRQQHHRLPPPPPHARPRSSGTQRLSESDLISVGSSISISWRPVRQPCRAPRRTRQPA